MHNNCVLTEYQDMPAYSLFIKTNKKQNQTKENKNQIERKNKKKKRKQTNQQQIKKENYELLSK